MLDHLKGVLTSLYQARIADLRSQASYWFSYRADPLYLAGEPVTIDLAVRSSADVSVLRTARATIEVQTRGPGSTSAIIAQRQIRGTRELTSVTLDPLPPGAYTLSITGARGAAPVSDVVVVAEANPPDDPPTTRSRQPRRNTARSRGEVPTN